MTVSAPVFRMKEYIESSESSAAFLLSEPQELPLEGEAKRLGLVGWVQNTSHGTVQGQIQGPTARVQELQEWLRKIGSPQSRISRAEFSNEKKIKALEHKEFQILK
ncbi:acylphosphatase-1 [Cyanistes caeruleus]|uniref:acylphosphatase-1 n=1 Tax=Cyanistes caeruleus TaxID=156563 RepID=UPI000CDA4105|nr:acylphosphatase-1 [Cyanistes caeruleus]